LVPSVLYAVTFWEQKLITIDTNTGQGTLITNLPISPRDLAGFRDALYVYGGAGQGVKLSQLDPLSGAILHQVTFTNKISGGEGAMDFRADGIAFITTSSGITGTLARLEMATTNATLVTADGGLSPSLDGLAFDAEGTLFGLTQNRSGAFSLCQVDQVTGATALIGDLGIFFSSVDGAVGGLAFAPNGNLYAAVGSSNASRLYLLNKGTGAATLVGLVGFAGVSGIRFFAPPRESVIPPNLAVQRQGNSVHLSWPTAAMDYQLQWTDSLAAGLWQTLTNEVQAVGVTNVVVDAISAAQRFYRLTR
jgi:hypothetical protein